MTDKITFILPTRNNIEYTTNCINYLSLFYNKCEVIILDDNSIDGTYEFFNNKNHHFTFKFRYFRNENDERLGHTILYDIGFKNASNDVCMILHADMIPSPHMIQNMIKHLSKKTVVCATRIEPKGLHPEGPEKILENCGLSPDYFNEDYFLELCKKFEVENYNKTTNGIFAPWMMYKDDFLELGGHDWLFYPMELEDSDIFNRMQLAGYKLIQSRDAFVYHFTCRGSRYIDGLGKDSKEYTENKENKIKDWIRKWKQPVLHDKFMNPIVKPVYDLAIYIENPSLPSLYALEPWFDRVYTNNELVNERYVFENYNKTILNLNDKIIFVPFKNIKTEIQNEKILFIIEKLNEFHVKSIETILAIVSNIEEYVTQFENDSECIFDVTDNIKIHLNPLKLRDIDITAKNIIAKNHKYIELKEKIKNIKEIM